MEQKKKICFTALFYFKDIGKENRFLNCVLIFRQFSKYKNRFLLLEGSSCLYIFIISVCLLGRRFFNLHSVSSNAVAESINVLNIALSSAQSTANSAQSTANSAQSTANSAQSAANSAQSTANSAQSAANSAQSTANSAQSTANSAWGARWNALVLNENDGGSIYVREAVLFYGAYGRYSVKYVANTWVTATNSWWGFDPASGDAKNMIGLFRA